MNAWYRDRAALSLIAFRYVPWLAAFSLAWEVAQLPLYTIWREASTSYLVFAVVHCTVGDVLIGCAALALALMLGREKALAQWHWRRVIGMTALLAAAYTLFSEWMNTTLYRWTYSELMPVLSIRAMRIGLSPVAQALLIPAAALVAGMRRAR